MRKMIQYFIGSRALAVLLLGQFFLQLCYYVLIPFLTMYLWKLGISAGAIGAILGIRSLFYLVGLFLSGSLVNMFSPKRVMMIGFTGTTAGYALMAMANLEWHFYLMMPVIGFFNGLAYPGESVLLVENTTQENRAEVFGLIRTLINLAASISPLLAVSIFMTWPRISFIAAGLIHFLYTLGAWAWVSGKFVKPEQKVTVGSEMRAYGAVLKDSKFLWLIVSLTLPTVSYFSLETTLSLHLNHHLENGLYWYSVILTMNTILVIIFQVIVTRLLRRIGFVNSILTGQLLYVISLLVVGWTNNAILIIAMFVIFTVGEMFISPSSNMLIVDNSKQEELAKYLTIGKLRLFLALPVASMAGGFVFEKWGGTVMMTVYALFALLGTVLLFLLRNSYIDSAVSAKAGKTKVSA